MVGNGMLECNWESGNEHYKRAQKIYLGARWRYSDSFIADLRETIWVST
jgi:hypothetical protein